MIIYCHYMYGSLHIRNNGFHKNTLIGIAVKEEDGFIGFSPTTLISVDIFQTPA